MTNKTIDIFYGDSDGDTIKISDSVLNKVIGNRLKDRRLLLGLNQAELGKKLNISGQQIHKYEAGTDQLSAPKIYELCSIFQILPSYFFDDLEEYQLAESQTGDYQSRDPEEVRLQKYISIYQEFSDPRLKKMLFEVIRLFAAQLKLMENIAPKPRVSRPKI